MKLLFTAFLLSLVSYSPAMAFDMTKYGNVDCSLGVECIFQASQPTMASCERAYNEAYEALNKQNRVIIYKVSCFEEYGVHYNNDGTGYEYKTGAFVGRIFFR